MGTESIPEQTIGDGTGLCGTSTDVCKVADADYNRLIWHWFGRITWDIERESENEFA